MFHSACFSTLLWFALKNLVSRDGFGSLYIVTLGCRYKIKYKKYKINTNKYKQENQSTKK